MRSIPTLIISVGFSLSSSIYWDVLRHAVVLLSPCYNLLTLLSFIHLVDCSSKASDRKVVSDKHSSMVCT
jgi:hypothetical protein